MTARMVGLPAGREAQDLHSTLKLVNVACEIIRTSIMRAEKFTREVKIGAVDQLCRRQPRSYLKVPQKHRWQHVGRRLSEQTLKVSVEPLDKSIGDGVVSSCVYVFITK